MAEEVRRDIIHHMGRRCRDWDYGGRAIYMITINLKERGRPVMAEWPRSLDDSAEAQEQNLPVSGQAQNWPGNGLRSASARFCASPETARFCASPETAKIYMPLTPLGEKVLSCWRRIPEFWPMVELLECQVMPDHFHGLLFVKGALLSSSGRPKTLGDVVRGFKTVDGKKDMLIISFSAKGSSSAWPITSAIIRAALPKKGPTPGFSGTWRI